MSIAKFLPLLSIVAKRIPGYLAVSSLGSLQPTNDLASSLSQWLTQSFNQLVSQSRTLTFIAPSPLLRSSQKQICSYKWFLHEGYELWKTQKHLHMHSGNCQSLCQGRCSLQGEVRPWGKMRQLAELNTDNMNPASAPTTFHNCRYFYYNHILVLCTEIILKPPHSLPCYVYW